MIDNITSEQLSKALTIVSIECDVSKEHLQYIGTMNNCKLLLFNILDTTHIRYKSTVGTTLEKIEYLSCVFMMVDTELGFTCGKSGVVSKKLNLIPCKSCKQSIMNLIKENKND